MTTHVRSYISRWFKVPGFRTSWSNKQSTCYIITDRHRATDKAFDWIW